MIRLLLRLCSPGRAGLAGVLLFSLSQSVVAAENGFLVTRDVQYSGAGKPDSEFQTLDVYWKDVAKKRPVIIYAHGGGWAFGDKLDVHEKPKFFSLHDISFISMNYRLRWEYSLDEQLEDIATVISWVKKNHQDYGLDPARIVLMGHGAGAHLVSLVGTDDSFLKARGLSLSDVKAVVAIDTSSFDIPEIMTQTGSFMEQRRHRLIFGEKEDVLRSASPITYVAKDKGIPPFALLYVADSETTSVQARNFSRALRAADVSVIMIPGNHKTTESIDEELGSPGDAPTLALIAFLRATI